MKSAAVLRFGLTAALLFALPGARGNGDTQTTPGSRQDADMSQDSQQAAPATPAYRSTAAQMLKSLRLHLHGKPDQDFAHLLVVQQQGVVDLARVAEAHAREPALRTLAGQLSASHAQRIAGTRDWLKAHSSRAADGGNGKRPDPGPVARAFQEAVLQMNLDFGVHYSGDADRDFAAVIQAHHQGADALARIELQHGRDAAMRKLAQTIVDEDSSDLEALRPWLSAR